MTNPSSRLTFSMLSPPMLENFPPFYDNHSLPLSKKVQASQPSAYLTLENLHTHPLPRPPFSEPLKRRSKKVVNQGLKSGNERPSLTPYFHQTLRLHLCCSKAGIQLNSLLANASGVNNETTVRDFLYFLFCFDRKSFKECLTMIILRGPASFCKILPKLAYIDAELVQELSLRFNNDSAPQLYDDLLQLFSLIQNFDDRCDYVKSLFSLPTHLVRKQFVKDFSPLLRASLPFPFFLSLGLVDPIFIKFLMSLETKIITHLLTENHQHSPKKIKALHFTLLCAMHSTPQQFGYKEIFEKYFPLFGRCNSVVDLETLWVSFKNDLLDPLSESHPYKPENIDVPFPANSTPNHTYDLYLDHFVRKHQSTLMTFKRYFEGKKLNLTPEPIYAFLEGLLPLFSGSFNCPEIHLYDLFKTNDHTCAKTSLLKGYFFTLFLKAFAFTDPSESKEELMENTIRLLELVEKSFLFQFLSLTPKTSPFIASQKIVSFYFLHKSSMFLKLRGKRPRLL